jgi:hypothetical protein
VLHLPVCISHPSPIAQAGHIVSLTLLPLHSRFPQLGEGTESIASLNWIQNPRKLTPQVSKTKTPPKGGTQDLIIFWRFFTVSSPLELTKGPRTLNTHLEHMGMCTCTCTQMCLGCWHLGTCWSSQKGLILMQPKPSSHLQWVCMSQQGPELPNWPYNGCHDRHQLGSLQACHEQQPAGPQVHGQILFNSHMQFL